MNSKLHIKKGDEVIVIAGESKSNDPARVLTVLPKENKAIVEGRNMMKKHTKPNAKYPQGGIIETEAPIHLSNLMLVVDGTPTKVGRKIDEETKKLVRYSKKTGKEIK